MFLSKRDGVYYLWYKHPLTGKKSKITTGSKTKTDAYRFLRHFDPKTECKTALPPKYLLSEFQKEYLEYANTIHTPNTCGNEKTAFEQFIRVIGDLPIRDVTVRHVEHFVASKQKETSAWTARKHFSHLASIFQRAIVWDKIEINPFRNVPKPRLPERIPSYFSQDQLSLLLQTIDDQDFRDLTIFAVMTGMRMGEIINLRWDCIDLSRFTILVKNTAEFTTKSKRNRLIPVNKHLLPILEARKLRATTPFVFHRDGIPCSTDYVTKKFKKFVRKAKVDDKLHFHSLRHSTASFLVQAGVPIYTVKELLGHSQLSTTLIYSHLAGSQLLESVNLISMPPQLPDIPLLA